MDLLTPTQITAYQKGVFPKTVGKNSSENHQKSVEEISSDLCQI
jgi:hypothetical protein